MYSKTNKYKYLGAIHIHSTFSDGTGDINTITKAAKKAGLDWIIITDHNAFDIEEGYYNGICVIKGEEISPLSENHYLACGINRFIELNNINEVIENVRNNGGFGFAAHPDESLSRKNCNPPIRWKDKNVIPDGVEIWNWFSQWGDNLNDKNLFSLAYSYLFKHKLVTAPYEETIKWWDSLNNKSNKIIPAIGSIDAHALKIKKYILPVTIFPYKDMFKTITNIISFNEPLADNFITRKAQILKAIKEGKNLILNRHLTQNIPEITISDDSNIVGIGDNIKLSAQTQLTVLTKDEVLIKIFRDGIEIKNVISNKLKMILNKVGKYRIEIIKNNRGFAYSNPIIVY